VKPFNLGVIPARGGSKGLKNKNILKLNGIPLISHAIRVANDSKFLDDIVVTTDSQEIAKVAQNENASVPFIRPKKLATDTSPMIDTVRHAVSEYEKLSNSIVDNVVLLQPTTPLRTKDDIDGSIKTFINQRNSESLITYNIVNSHHPNYMYHKENGIMVPIISQSSKSDRRQDYVPALIRNGVVYVSSRTQIMNGPKVYNNRPIGYEIPAIRSCNIDSEEDFFFAEFIYDRLNKK